MILATKSVTITFTFGKMKVCQENLSSTCYINDSCSKPSRCDCNDLVYIRLHFLNYGTMLTDFKQPSSINSNSSILIFGSLQQSGMVGWVDFMLLCTLIDVSEFALTVPPRKPWVYFILEDVVHTAQDAERLLSRNHNPIPDPQAAGSSFVFMIWPSVTLHLGRYIYT